MVSAVDRSKRALVALLCYLATAYGCVVDVTRDSDDAAVRKAYRLVSRRVHPDRGGSEEDQKTEVSCYRPPATNEYLVIIIKMML